MEYIPNPIDTESIELTEELIMLTEQMAKNVHEVWARQRMKEGWVYGNKRDDELKTHPSLVPYSELSESEKQYDRNTSQETIKMILKLGFEIKRKS